METVTILIRVDLGPDRAVALLRWVEVGSVSRVYQLASCLPLRPSSRVPFDPCHR